jgi:AraC family transcriptional regulator
MSKTILHDPLEALLVPPRARQSHLPVADRRPADAEMARDLKTTPLRTSMPPTDGDKQ